MGWSDFGVDSEPLVIVDCLEAQGCVLGACLEAGILKMLDKIPVFASGSVLEEPPFQVQKLRSGKGRLLSTDSQTPGLRFRV